MTTPRPPKLQSKGAEKAAMVVVGAWDHPLDCFAR